MTGDAWDVVVIGAGAAGLATAIFAARARPALRVVCLDGARHIGAKILVSGGSRCNVTNRAVSERDFWGGSPRFVRNVLRAWPADRTVAFFDELGVPLHEEDDGKLFPNTNQSRTVLDGLLREAQRLGIVVRSSSRVAGIVRDVETAGRPGPGAVGGGFRVELVNGPVLRAARVVLATGGRSLPKTGSDGVGYALAQALGHRIVDTTPALVPLVLDGDRHVALSGRTHLATLRLLVGGTCVVALTGSLLWTHVGVSGPVALDLSRHWHRAVLETDCETPAASGGVRRVGVSVSVCPWETHESLDAWLLTQERDRSRSHVATVLSSRLPAAVADLWVERAGIAADTPMAHLARSDRRRLVSSLLDTPLEVRGSRGYNYAEVTAGGVPLDEVDSRSMESRACPGLFLVGEILDVDGRLGGFNFQWAWSSAWVAGQALGQQSA